MGGLGDALGELRVEMIAYEVARSGRMFAQRVPKSGECSLGGLHFFEGLTFWAPALRDLVAENFPF